MLTALLTLASSALAEKLTVIFPHVRAPYAEIFDQINEGISSEYPHEINHIKLPSSFSAAAVADNIESDRVIALGKRGLMVANELNSPIPVAIGALPVRPNTLSGVSLLSSPASLFISLRNLAPNVNTITVIYSETSSWIIDEAHIEARKLDLTLNAILVKNLQEAAQAYNNYFTIKNKRNQAIWLPLDNITANEKVIVPKILEQAWNQKIIVFSSKPNHARRGALFSAVPDNYEMGKQLVRLLNKIQTQQKNNPMLEPLAKIKLAVNLRTAAHLGYKYSAAEKSEFAMTFPN
ncbi:hypothetical protein C2869_13705 [Saccharobesus litoralis]|uniref:ABC transporter substrate-binding protein n=1 Tax=Saccharobesus litoralis TaxID=2172099 RepID=A0A2S0VTK8_9ALTE|nr:ABC transporter substrate binding protein [Saccharobesus litoralis]AWB67430.1 hypothetical protein C2869_13705 [Saccharobesus litoralis]